MQALGANANNLSLNSLLGQCWLEQAVAVHPCSHGSRADAE